VKRLLSHSYGALAAWAAILTVLWILSWAIWPTDSEVVILLASVIVATFAQAAAAALEARRDPEPGDQRPIAVVTATHATSLAGIAIVCAVLGLEFGPWLLYISAGLLLVALLGLARERRAARLALQRVEGVARR
jgi:hypothetical protein